MKKQPSARTLAKQLRIKQAEADELRKDLQLEVATVQHLHKKLGDKVDLTMIESRIRLANAVGQLIEAVTRVVPYIVAKEVL